MRFVFIGLFGLIAGCAGSPVQLAMMSPEKLKLQEPEQLCQAYHHTKDKEVRAELESRSVLTDNEWSLIDSKKIAMDMSRLALVCSWGYPGVKGDINKSTGSWGTREQWVYWYCSGCGRNYVYLKNGRITGWQD